tara:strand:+ start:478 stop:741 length:264 start_codon:yes stop_codon:yes gene_type:complete
MSGNRFRDFSDVGPSVDGLFDRELRAENDENGNAIYVGYAKAGSATSDSVWLIKQYTYDANSAVTNGKIANNNLSFSFAWDDRATFF